MPNSRLFFMDTNPASHPIQGALFPVRSENVTVNTSSNRTQTAFSHTIVRVVSDTDCYIALGDGGVSAQTGGLSTLLPAGAIEYFNCMGATYIAVITKTNGTGLLNVAEMA